MILFPPRVLDPSGLARDNMLYNSWVVLAHTDCNKDTVVDWECYHWVPIPITSLHRVWVTMVWLAPASDDQPPPNSGSLRFGYHRELKCCPNSRVVLVHTDCTIGVVIVWECYPGVHMLIKSVHKFRITVVRLASASNDRSLPNSWSLRFV